MHPTIDHRYLCRQNLLLSIDSSVHSFLHFPDSNYLFRLMFQRAESVHVSILHYFDIPLYVLHKTHQYNYQILLTIFLHMQNPNKKFFSIFSLNLRFLSNLLSLANSLPLLSRLHDSEYLHHNHLLHTIHHSRYTYIFLQFKFLYSVAHNINFTSSWWKFHPHFEIYSLIINDFFIWIR